MTVSADASSLGLGAILLQEQPSGRRRLLTLTELEKEFGIKLGRALF